MAKNATKNTLETWVETYLNTEEPRSKSLIISVFGDAISPYSKGIWLGELISLMSTLNVNERLVRTSAFRLADEGWLQPERIGRKSFYSLSPSGTSRFESAYKHIYLAPKDNWDGDWTIVVIQRNIEATTERSEVRKELEWNGFALVSNGVFMHPTASTVSASKIILNHGLEDRSFIFRAKSYTDSHFPDSELKISECWNLEEVNQRYQKFIEDFKPTLSLLEKNKLSPLLAFQLQTLMIHSFRRANLHDPQLPSRLLPESWPRLEAFKLCQKIYKQTCKQSHAYVGNIMEIDTSLAHGTRLNISVEDRFKSS